MIDQLAFWRAEGTPHEPEQLDRLGIDGDALDAWAARMAERAAEAMMRMIATSEEPDRARMFEDAYGFTMAGFSAQAFVLGVIAARQEMADA